MNRHMFPARAEFPIMVSVAESSNMLISRESARVCPKPFDGHLAPDQR